ncbi:MAG: hypothetical protein ACREAS_03580, partial [Nitrososphaera sp.]
MFETNSTKVAFGALAIVVVSFAMVVVSLALGDGTFVMFPLLLATIIVADCCGWYCTPNERACGPDEDNNASKTIAPTIPRYG